MSVTIKGCNKSPCVFKSKQIVEYEMTFVARKLLNYFNYFTRFRNKWFYFLF